MNIVIAGGGTGGHLFPGIAVYEKLMESGMDCKVYFVGTEKGIEGKFKDDFGFKSFSLNVSGFSGKNIMGKIKSIRNLIGSYSKVKGIYREIKPEFVLGLGGYVSFMPLLVARFQGKKAAIMEQNLEPGLAVKILSLFGITVFASFEETWRYLPFSRNVTVTGNPVRKDIVGLAETLKTEGVDRIKNNKSNMPFSDAPGKGLSVFVFGGSQGASSLNSAFMGAVKKLKSEISDNLTIFHQTGDKDYESVKNFYEKSNIKKFQVFPFTKNIADYYSRCDFVISRAGAGTLSELVVLKKPAILVPYPFAASGHQEKNARIFSEKGCFLLVKDDKKLEEILLQNIDKIFYNRILLDIMHDSLKKISFEDPASKIASIIINRE